MGLFPHGLLEIPNFLFYQGLSQYMLWTVLTEKSMTSFLERERRYVRYYLISYYVLLIAGIMEGLLG
ncbi:stage II sporulation protein M [Streptococcus equi subsp. equi]|nr:stage II sporulation protein M [Streptococcus equi subsp. equi]